MRFNAIAELKQIKLFLKISSSQRAALGSPVNPGGMISCWRGYREREKERDASACMRRHKAAALAPV